MSMMIAYYLILILILSPVWVCAETLKIPSSSGGIIDKEIEQQYETEEVSPDKEVPSVEIDIPEQELDIPEGKKILLKKIALQGNTIFSSKELQPILTLYEGTEMSMKDIHELCRKIQNRYIESGYFLVRVYPPAQEIMNRTLKIEVMEATLGDIEIVGNKHYKTKFIASYFNKYLGKTINYNDLLKTLLLINENSDLAVGTIFQKGKDLGTVDMIIRVKDSDPYHISADFNNYGSGVTSRCRSGVRTDIGNVLQDGDNLSFIGVGGYPLHQLKFLDAIYTTPLNSRGSDLDLSFLFSEFHVDKMSELHIHGTTQVAGCKFSQALQRTKKLNTDIYTGFEYKQIRNFANHETTAFDKLRVVALGCKVDYMDSYKGHNVADIGVFGGIPKLLGGLRSVDGRCSREDAGGRFIYVDANYQRVQRLPFSSLLLLSLQGQFSFYKLPLSEEFYIGGINTVRGYPLAIGLGDTGFCANAEIRIPPLFMGSTRIIGSKKLWKEVIQFVGFLDHGEVFVHGGGIFEQSNRISLTSAGLGARVFGPFGIDCSADVGFPLGSVHLKPDTPNAIFYFRINMRFL